MENFPELLEEAQRILASKIEEASPIGLIEDDLAGRLFRVGRSIGLTDKEITKVLLQPIISVLRPGLAGN